MDHHKVGLLAGSDRTNALAFPEPLGAVGAGNVNCLQGSEPGLDQQLHLPLVAEPRQDAPVAGRVFAG